MDTLTVLFVILGIKHGVLHQMYHRIRLEANNCIHRYKSDWLDPSKRVSKRANLHFVYVLAFKSLVRVPRA